MEGPQTVHLITVHISCSQTEFHLKRKLFTYTQKKKKKRKIKQNKQKKPKPKHSPNLTHSSQTKNKTPYIHCIEYFVPFL